MIHFIKLPLIKKVLQNHADDEHLVQLVMPPFQIFWLTSLNLVTIM